MSTAPHGSGELTSEEQQINDETDRFARGRALPLAPRMDDDNGGSDDQLSGRAPTSRGAGVLVRRGRPPLRTNRRAPLRRD